MTGHGRSPGAYGDSARRGGLGAIRARRPLRASAALGRGAQASGDVLGIARGCQRSDDCDTRCARGDHFRDVALVDAADRKERNRGMARRVLHKLDPDRRPAGLCGGRIYRTDADVVDIGADGGVDLGR